MNRLVCVMVMAALVSPLVSCGGDKITGKGATLANRANGFYAKERFQQATNAYRLFVEQNPDSPYRRTSIIGLADSSYKEEDYFTAILYYERFLELYPIDKLTPRAVFYLGMSHYNDSHSPDRDQTPSFRAKETFAMFLERFPDHPLTPFAKKYKGEMEARIAQSEMEIIRFYSRVNQNHSAVIRLKEYIEAHPDSAEMPEAMFLLGKSYYDEQSYKKAAMVFTAVIEKYPKSDFASQAANLAKTLKIKK
ncbi:hypothetical protein MNBD_NITROSPINAE02-871 [hydrothermal vent metagenome]|uniref:Outer membrane lipoprotein BamD-like domain-containing protein n=1 Tax=hydrothermal vent metagenome TaxID=652676 RepID=A0A3B1CRD6_9ZZZZ